MAEKIKLEISSWTIVKALLIIILFYLLFLIKDIIALFFIVLLLAAAFRPIVNKWEKVIGRVFSVISLFLIFLLIIVAAVYVIVPPVVTQSKDLFANIPDLFNRYEFLKKYSPDVKDGISTISKNFGNITSEFVSLTAGIFGGFIAFFTVIVMTIYLLLEKDSFSKFIKSIIPADHREAILNVVRKITLKLGDWFRGQMLLGLIVGALDWIGLSIIGAPYALTLALISGIFEIVPTIGPLVAGLIAVLVTLADSPIKALFVLILYTVVQQLENSLIVPKVMQKAIGLSPVIIILAILIGGQLLGIVGAVIAVPIAASIAVVVQEWPVIQEALKKDE